MNKVLAIEPGKTMHPGPGTSSKTSKITINDYTRQIKGRDI